MRLGRGNIRCAVCGEMVLYYPPVSVAIRLECLRGLRHGRFDGCTTLTFIEREGGDVYQCCNVWIVTGFADDGPAVAVADQNHRPAHGVDCGLRVFLVVGVRGLGWLGNRYRASKADWWGQSSSRVGVPPILLGSQEMSTESLSVYSCCSMKTKAGIWTTTFRLTRAILRVWIRVSSFQSTPTEIWLPPALAFRSPMESSRLTDTSMELDPP